MDAEQVNTVNRSTPPPRPPAGKSVQGPPSVNHQAGSGSTPSPEDIVQLSSQGQRILERETGSANQNLQREIEVGDDNLVVLKIRDQTTGEVVRQIPAEEQVRLRQAIQEIVSSQAGEA